MENEFDGRMDERRSKNEGFSERLKKKMKTKSD
jgi:hypothetical protein